MSANRNTDFNVNDFVLKTLMGLLAIGYSVGVAALIVNFSLFNDRDMTTGMKDQAWNLSQAAWDQFISALNTMGPLEIIALLAVAGQFFAQPERELMPRANTRFLEVEDSDDEEEPDDDMVIPRVIAAVASEEESNAPAVLEYNALEQRLSGAYDIFGIQENFFLDAVTHALMVNPVLLITARGETTTHAVDETTAIRILAETPALDPISRAPVFGYRPLRNLKAAIEHWVKAKEDAASALPLLALPRAEAMKRMRQTQTLFSAQRQRGRSRAVPEEIPASERYGRFKTI